MGNPLAGVELAPQVDLTGILVLVVDDQRYQPVLCRTWYGSGTVMAASVRTALEELECAAKRGDPFRLVLTDAYMPDVWTASSS